MVEQSKVECGEMVEQSQVERGVNRSYKQHINVLSEYFAAFSFQIPSDQFRRE